MNILPFENFTWGFSVGDVISNAMNLISTTVIGQLVLLSLIFVVATKFIRFIKSVLAESRQDEEQVTNEPEE